MNEADGSRVQRSYVAETTYGVTPGTPTMLAIRATGDTLGLNKDTFESEEQRSDRMIEDLRHGLLKPEGDISFEATFGDIDTFLEAALGGTWATNVLKAGTAKRYFSIEKGFTDISQYLVFSGMFINTFTLNFQMNQIVKGSFGFVGKGISGGATSLGTPTAASTNKPFDSFTGSIQEGGSAIAYVTALNLSLNNQGVRNTALMDDEAVGFSLDASRLTGSVSVYLKDLVHFNKWLSETESSLQVTMTDPGGNSYTILIPRIKYTGGSLPAQRSGPVMLDLPWTALRDGTEGSNIKITRTAA